MQELREAVYLAERSGMSAHKLAQRLRHPDLLARVCEESPYQTRADHKERNRENMQFSDRRKGVVRGTGAGGNAGGEGSPAALGGAPAPVSGPQ